MQAIRFQAFAAELENQVPFGDGLALNSGGFTPHSAAGMTKKRKDKDMAHSKSVVSHYWIFIGGGSGSQYWSRSGENMGLGYDIFRELSDGHPLWIAQAATLKEAQEKLDTLARTVPAKYFIRDATNAKIIARSGTETAEEKNA